MVSSVLLILLLTVILAISQEQESVLEQIRPKFATPCTTPNNDEGVCVEVKNCTILFNAIRSRKKESYSFIRESQCNDDLTRPKVCCGKFDNYLHQVTTPRNDNALNPPVSSLFPKDCGSQSVADKIFGGIEADLTEFPWMARLRRRRDNGVLTYACVGFLISEKFVLTAAHCIHSKELEVLGPVYQVQLGEYNTQTDPDCKTFLTGKMCADPPQLLRTAEPVVHPSYTGDVHQHNDIAVIPLKEPAKFTEYVYPICLTTTHSSIPYMSLSGWGKTEIKDISNEKLKVTIRRADKTFCTHLYNSTGVRLSDSQFCAGGEAGRDSCQGDSGGPIMTFQFEHDADRWYAEGIVSIGRGCGLKDWPGVYTSIPYFIPWIETVMDDYLNHKEEEAENQERRTICTTPNGEWARCIPINNCTILQNAVKNDLSPQKIRFLRESQCGYDEQPYVCCGSVDDYQNAINRQ